MYSVWQQMCSNFNLLSPAGSTCFTAVMMVETRETLSGCFGSGRCWEMSICYRKVAMRAPIRGATRGTQNHSWGDNIKYYIFLFILLHKEFKHFKQMLTSRYLLVACFASKTSVLSIQNYVVDMRNESTIQPVQRGQALLLIPVSTFRPGRLPAALHLHPNSPRASLETREDRPEVGYPGNRIKPPFCYYVLLGLNNY